MDTFIRINCFDLNLICVRSQLVPSEVFENLDGLVYDEDEEIFKPRSKALVPVMNSTMFYYMPYM